VTVYGLWVTFLPCDEVRGRVDDLIAGLVGFVSAVRSTPVSEAMGGSSEKGKRMGCIVSRKRSKHTIVLHSEQKSPKNIYYNIRKGLIKYITEFPLETMCPSNLRNSNNVHSEC